MGALSIRLPESLHQNLKQAAELEGVSINQLVAVTLAEKVALLLQDGKIVRTLEQRREAGSNISHAEYLILLGKLGKGEPVPGDELT